MTIKFTEPNIFDKILNSISRKRAYKIPGRDKAYDYYTLQPESFLRALLRPADVQPPPGWFYKNDITNKNSLADLERGNHEQEKEN